MSKKVLRVVGECSSITNNPKWLCYLKLVGFSSRKAEQNEKIMKKIFKMVKDYNQKEETKQKKPKNANHQTN